MSTNFYLYPKEAILRGDPHDESKEIHVAKRNYYGEDYGALYTLQAVNVDADPLGAGYRVPVLPRIESWRDWSRFLLASRSTWAVLDEYGTTINTSDFIGNIMFQGFRSLPHERCLEWRGNAGYGDSGRHYLDSDGFSMCSAEFS